MRLFYASFLGVKNIKAYESLVRDIAAESRNVVRSVPSGSHHLTLGFLGEVADVDLRHCLDTLEAASSFRVIPFSLAPPQVLSGRGTPRLIKADLLEGRERVTMLKERLRRELLERLPDLDVRLKPPHVTIARFNKRADRGAARKVTELLRQREEELSRPRADELTSVQLVKSTLTPKGPVYEVVGESLLDASGDSSKDPT